MIVPPEHLDENLTNEQSAERIVSYFAKISQEYKPIEEERCTHTYSKKAIERSCGEDRRENGL